MDGFLFQKEVLIFKNKFVTIEIEVIQMKMMSHYLIVMLSIMLFVFRLIVVFTTVMGIEFIVTSINVNYEIVFLFIMMLSIILLTKSKLSGAILFLVSSLIYYGPSLLSEFAYLSTGNISLDGALRIIITLICVVIPIVAFFIIAFAKQQEKKPVDKKTDFFYKNEAYDRKYDERADKNNYRTL